MSNILDYQRRKFSSDYYECKTDDGICDQLNSSEWNLNENGFPQSDIVQLVKAVDQSQFDAIFARMREIKVNNKNSDIPLKDMLKTIRPRMMQDPVEQERFINYLYDNYEAVQDVIEREELEKLKAKQEPTEPTEPTEPKLD